MVVDFSVKRSRMESFCMSLHGFTEKRRKQLQYTSFACPSRRPGNEIVDGTPADKKTAMAYVCKGVAVDVVDSREEAESGAVTGISC